MFDGVLVSKFIEFLFFFCPQDHGSPESFQSLTSVTIRVKDADDQNPVFTRQVYKTNVTEAAVITVSLKLFIIFFIFFSFVIFARLRKKKQ